MVEQNLEDTFRDTVLENAKIGVGWVYRRIKPRASWDDAEDIVHNALLDSWRWGLKKYEPGACRSGMLRRESCAPTAPGTPSG